MIGMQGMPDPILGMRGIEPDRKNTKRMQLGLRVDDVFATTLYGGSFNARSFTFPVRAGSSGALHWNKRRQQPSSHQLFDTSRGLNSLSTDSSAAEAVTSLTAIRDNGFDVRASSANPNDGGNVQYVNWTFKRAERFFDIVTYAGNANQGRVIPHRLGVKPGLILIKRLDTGENWPVYHPATTSANLIYFDLVGAANGSNANLVWASTEPTANDFTLGGNPIVNGSGGTYVAYLFAHDTSPSGIIQCGRYDGNGSPSGAIVNLGWEPQWLLLKRYQGGEGEWIIVDSKRSPTNTRSDRLSPNSAEAEQGVLTADFNPTGFQIRTNGPEVGFSGSSYLYMAIRKGD